jgi:hypothetical protein
MCIIKKFEVTVIEYGDMCVCAAVTNYNTVCCAMCSLGSELLLTHIYINS